MTHALSLLSAEPYRLLLSLVAIMGFVGLNAARPVEPGNSDLCFVWDGTAAEAMAHLDAHGVAVELGPVERRGARGTGTSVYFRDPDGSLLELIAYGR